MSKYIEGDYLTIRDGALYIENRMSMGGHYWSEHSTNDLPEMVCLLWRQGNFYASGLRFINPDPTVFDGQRLEERYNGYYLADGTFLGALDNRRKADLVERYPIPAPKLRKGQECRWEINHWEIYSKSTGWRRA